MWLCCEICTLLSLKTLRELREIPKHVRSSTEWGGVRLNYFENSSQPKRLNLSKGRVSGRIGLGSWEVFIWWCKLVRTDLKGFEYNIKSRKKPEIPLLIRKQHPNPQIKDKNSGDGSNQGCDRACRRETAFVLGSASSWRKWNNQCALCNEASFILFCCSCIQHRFSNKPLFMFHHC